MCLPFFQFRFSFLVFLQADLTAGIPFFKYVQRAVTKVTLPWYAKRQRKNPDQDEKPADPPDSVHAPIILVPHDLYYLISIWRLAARASSFLATLIRNTPSVYPASIPSSFAESGSVNERTIEV